jgi:putative membrane protein
VTDNISAILQTFSSGFPVLLLHFGLTLILLVFGGFCYTRLTPFRERELIVTGNTAAGVVLGGAYIALSIPLAAVLATSAAWLDIVIWGVVAIMLQLATFIAVVAIYRDLKSMIESGNTAAAAVVVGIQIAVALLNAGTMAG